MNDITGDDILDGNIELEIYIPDRWTPEYVEYRLIKAFEVERRAFRRPGPKEFGSVWPETLYESGDHQGWADQYRGRVWDGLSAGVDKPGHLDVEKAVEALSWGLQYLHSQRDLILADAIHVSARAKAYGLEIKDLIHERWHRAFAIARRTAAERIPAARQAWQESCQRARDEMGAWFCREFERRKIALDGPAEKGRRVDLLKRNAVMKFGERATEPFIPPQPDVHEAMPGIVLSVSTLGRLRREGHQILAERLERARTPVR